MYGVRWMQRVMAVRSSKAQPRRRFARWPQLGGCSPLVFCVCLQQSDARNSPQNSMGRRRSARDLCRRPLWRALLSLPVHGVRDRPSAPTLPSRHSTGPRDRRPPLLWTERARPAMRAGPSLPRTGGSCVRRPPGRSVTAHARAEGRRSNTPGSGPHPHAEGVPPHHAPCLS